MNGDHDNAGARDATLARSGLRLTEQRRQVYDALLARRDHPSAVEVFMRVKARVPHISLATVYNCLEALADCGLVRHVPCEKGGSRFCPNLEEHGHFFCEECGAISDVPLRKDGEAGSAWHVPRGAFVRSVEATFRGLCPSCKKTQSNPRRGTNHQHQP
jgi:Fur family peroxide stress response transcriptional regulator